MGVVHIIMPMVYIVLSNAPSWINLYIYVNLSRGFYVTYIQRKPHNKKRPSSNYLNPHVFSRLFCDFKMSWSRTPIQAYIIIHRSSLQQVSNRGHAHSNMYSSFNSKFMQINLHIIECEWSHPTQLNQAINDIIISRV